MANRGFTRSRLMVLTLIPIAAIYVVILGVGLITNTKRSITITQREMSNLVETLAQRFDGELRRVAQVAELNARQIETFHDLGEEEIYRLLENGIRQDPLIFGAAMAFVEYGFDDRESFAPYVCRSGPDFRRLDIAASYDYIGDPDFEWWHEPRRTGKSMWTEPYFDEGAGNIMMSTYSTPVGSEGTVRGITTVDIPLERMQRFVGTDLNVVVLTSEGHFVHRTEGMFDDNPTIFEVSGGEPNVLALAEEMTAGRSGQGSITSADGEKELVFFAPLRSAGWSFVAYLPEREALSDVHREARWLSSIMALSLVLIAGALWFVSGLVWRAQAKTEASEGRFRGLVESAPDAMVIVDRSGTIVMVNDQAVRTFGHQLQDMLGNKVHMLVPERVRAAHAGHIEEFFSAPSRRDLGRGIELFGTRAHGQEFPAEISLSPLETDDGLLVSSVVRDITERRKAEEELAAAEERSRMVLESTSEGIFGVDSEGRVAFVNSAAAKLLGYAKAELTGESIHDLIHHSRTDGSAYPIVDCPMHTTITQGVTSEVDDEVLWRKDGTCFAVEYSSTPLRKSDDLVGAVIVFRDITERKRSEEELLKARDEADAANRAKSSFLANMSHELRTPMNAIIGYSELIAEEMEDDGIEDFLPDLNKIQSAGGHLLSLINDILDLSKIEAGRMDLFLERFVLADMLTESAATIEPLMKRNRIQFQTEIPDNLGTIRADVTKLRQALFNLLSNASKFALDGEVTLSAERVELDGDSWVRLSVSDSGIGIPSDKIETVFEAFSQADGSTTRDYGGTGLGLPISRRFCQMMGGDILVESEVGVGSTFIIELPTKVDPMEAARASLSSASAAERTETPPNVGTGDLVLIIDDDPDARDLLSRTLVAEGYRVAVAPDGPTGLLLAAELVPDLITLDVMMPGMDGWTVLRELKAEPKLRTTPVIMISIIAEQEMGFALGAHDYLNKPIDRKRLIERLHELGLSTGSRVLVVDDDADTRAMLSRALTRDGFEPIEAENGLVGLEKMTETEPDIVLLDLMMPVMDGFEFVQRLQDRGEDEQTPIVVMTSRTLTESERELLCGRVQQVLKKQERGPQSIVHEIHRILASPDSHR